MNFASLIPYRNKLEDGLYDLGKRVLKSDPNKTYFSKQNANDVLDKLTECSTFTIVDTDIGRNIGRRTLVLQTLPYAVLNLILVADDALPPFEKLLDEFIEILDYFKEELQIKEGSIQRKLTSIEFQTNHKSINKLRILPAANLSLEENLKSMSEEYPKESHKFYKNSFAMRHWKFMESHNNSFVRVIVRISSFWLSTLHFSQELPVYDDLCTMMELIGVAAARQELAYCYPYTPSTIRGFLNALKMICNLSKLRLAFKKVIIPHWILFTKKKWFQVTENELEPELVVPSIIGSKDILERERFIVEPGNPFSDLLEDKNKEFIDEFSNFAEVSKLKLEELESTDETDETFLLKLFEAQPRITDAFPLAMIPNFCAVYFGNGEVVRCSVSPGIQRIRNHHHELIQRADVQLLLKLLERQLSAAVMLATKVSPHGEQRKEEIVFESVERAFKEVVENSLGIEEGSGCLRKITEKEDRKMLERMDVTMAIPYEVANRFGKPNTYQVMFGLSWN